LCRDGKRIVTGGADRTVRLWETDGQLVRVLGGHEGLVFAVSADDAGRRIAAASKDGVVSLWDVPDGAVVPVSASVPGR
jgi:WD40 repeat protein